MKGLTAAIIPLFFGVAFLPSINANINKEAVESKLIKITTEVYGVNVVKPHTVQLTKEDALEVENLFDSIKEQLDNAKTREDTILIFNEAVVKLDKYGLLSGLSVEEVQSLVTGKYQNSRIMKPLESTYGRNRGYFENVENFLCLIAGKTNKTIFGGNVGRVCYTTMYYTIKFGSWAQEHGFDILADVIDMFQTPIIVLFIIGIVIRFICSSLNPIPFGHTIGFGKEEFDLDEWKWYPHAASGWLFTQGLNGIKEWKDSFFGQLKIPVIFINVFDFFYPGVFGFTGIKLLNFEKEKSFYLGSALYVKLDSEPPDWLPWS